jgi:alpha-tubulin suppressor-like RCC1 family protein
MGVVRIVLVVALVAGAAALGVDPAFAKGPPKPVISGFAVTRATVGSGGSTAITASVSNAKECTVSSNKPVAGLPETFNCESGPVDSDVTMPANAGKKPLKIKLTLTVVGAGGKAKAKATVEVTTADFKIEKLQRVEGEVSYTTGALTAELGQGIQYEIVVTNTGKLPLNFSEVKDNACESVSPSGSTELQAGKSETFTCRHTLTAFGGYRNEASIEGNEGTGTKTSNSVKVNVNMTGYAVQVSVGSAHTCAVLSTGHIACWGGNHRGQLGDGTTTDSHTPVEVQGISTAVQVSAGGDHACAVLSTGHIDCWGRNEEGQLGDGTTTNSDTPVEVQGISNATAVAAADEGDTCALLASGHLECWGRNEWGQLGNEHFNERPNETPVEVANTGNATGVGASGSNTCAALSTGQVDCWGENSEGQVGNGEFFEGFEGEPRWEFPVEVLNISDGTQVGVGTARFACAVRSGGGVGCWGSDQDGQLGDGNFERQDTPAEVQGISTANQLSTGGTHACALLADDHVDCWGDGGLGNPTAHGKQNTPVEVRGVSNATEISAGGADTCALLPSHQIDCWGANANGQLGNGTTTESETPVEVEGT